MPHTAVGEAASSFQLSALFPRLSPIISSGYFSFGSPSVSSVLLRVWDYPNKHFSFSGKGPENRKNRKRVLVCCACCSLVLHTCVTLKPSIWLPKKSKKKHYESRFPIVFLYFCFVVPEGYSSSWFASCMPLAVAVMIVSSLLPISSSRLSSCRRWVDLSTSLSGKKN